MGEVVCMPHREDHTRRQLLHLFALIDLALDTGDIDRARELNQQARRLYSENHERGGR